MSQTPELHGWVVIIGNFLGLPEGTPGWILSMLGLALIYLVVILPSGAILSFLERKISADLQARVGPSRIGAAGFLQPAADLLKLLQKDDLHQDNWKETLWLTFHAMALYSTVAVIPLGSMVLMVDTDMSALIPFWSVLVLALGTILLGFSQKSVSGWFGGVRVAAQALVGSVPALVSLLCAGVYAGGFRWSGFAAAQSASPLGWTILARPPFNFIAFVIFVISGLIVLCAPPMDVALSGADTHGGVSSGLYGRKLPLFRMGRFYGFFLWSVICVVIFLGAWILPFEIGDSLRGSGHLELLQVLELVWLLAKTFVLMLLVSGVARVSPRGRVDQVTDFSWKVLSPVSLFALIGSCLWALWGAM